MPPASQQQWSQWQWRLNIYNWKTSGQQYLLNTDQILIITIFIFCAKLLVLTETYSCKPQIICLTNHFVSFTSSMGNLSLRKPMLKMDWMRGNIQSHVQSQPQHSQPTYLLPASLQPQPANLPASVSVPGVPSASPVAPVLVLLLY